MNNADEFADKFATALKARPAPFLVEGKEAAVVTSEGNMTMVSGTQLNSKQAIDLRVWIKKNFMEATA